MSIETTPAGFVRGEQLLVRVVVASIIVHVEEVENKLVLDMLTANQEDVTSRLLAAVEKLVIRTVHKVVTSLAS